MYKRTEKPEIYLITGYTDFRCGINSLCYRLKEIIQIDIFSNTLFIFCCKRKDKIKMLYWGGSGFWLLTYRLEEGKFQWLKKQDLKVITYKQLEWLLEGLEIEPKKYNKEVKKRLII